MADLPDPSGAQGCWPAPASGKDTSVVDEDVVRVDRAHREGRGGMAASLAGWQTWRRGSAVSLDPCVLPRRCPILRVLPRHSLHPLSEREKPLGRDEGAAATGVSSGGGGNESG
jgi:hypothetical protein